MKLKKIIFTIITFLIIWSIFNLLPVIPVKYTEANPNEIINSLPKVCSLNYLSCYDSRDDFGITYPKLLMNEIAFWLVIIILPVLLTWIIFNFIINSKIFRNYFSK